jgi:hypothetical protein
MRRLIIILAFFFLWNSINCQNITSAEYFFDDNDQGVGNNTTLGINQLNESFSISTAGLTQGFHDIYIRVFDQTSGIWSHYDRAIVYIGLIPSEQDIIAARYFIADGNAVSLSVNSVGTSINESYTIPITGLSNGFHSLYLETQHQDGTWSHYDRSLFYVGIVPPTQSITGARYYIDGGSSIDLSVNNTGTSITESYTVPITGLSVGFHSLYIETQHQDGTWSHYDRSLFYVGSIPSEQNIVAARYFFDNESPTDLSINTPASNVIQDFSISVTGFSDGFHSFYIEVQVEDGTWSMYDRKLIYIQDFSTANSEVTTGEYFIDEDLGIGNNTPLNISMVNQVIEINTTGISEGDHLFCVRVRNEDGIWSLYDCDFFTIDNSLGVDESFHKATKISPNPFVSDVSIDVPRDVQLKKISIYDILGKQVFSHKGDLRVLDLHSLKSGVYILKLNAENESASFKIIKN